MKRRKGRHSTRWYGWLGLILGLCVACGPTPHATLEPLIQALPTSTDYHVIDRSYEEFMIQDCRYTRVYLLYASSLSLPDAIAAYEDAIKTMGWAPQRTMFNEIREDKYQHAQHDELTVGGATWFVEDLFNVSQAHQQVTTLFVVTMTHITPEIKEC